MQRLLSYIISAMVSAVGWKLGLILGPVTAFFVSLVFAGVGLFMARRWLQATLN